MCSELYGESKTQTYLGELKELVKLTGQDYTEVLKNVMGLLGQSITKLSPIPMKEMSEPDVCTKHTVVQYCPFQSPFRCYSCVTRIKG